MKVASTEGLKVSIGEMIQIKEEPLTSKSTKPSRKRALGSATQTILAACSWAQKNPKKVFMKSKSHFVKKMKSVTKNNLCKDLLE